MLAITNQRFNGAAKQQANVLHVKLMDGDDLVELLQKFPMTQGELAGFLLSA